LAIIIDSVGVEKCLNPKGFFSEEFEADSDSIENIPKAFGASIKRNLAFGFELGLKSIR
jgi:hypothetical protein